MNIRLIASYCIAFTLFSCQPSTDIRFSEEVQTGKEESQEIQEKEKSVIQYDQWNKNIQNKKAKIDSKDYNEKLWKLLEKLKKDADSIDKDAKQRYEQSQNVYDGKDTEYGQEDVNTTEESTITGIDIAIVLPFNTKYRKFSQDVVKSLILSINDYNRSNITFKVYDTEGSEFKTKLITREITEQNPDLIIGTFRNETTKVLANRMKNFNIPIISFSYDKSLLKDNKNLILFSYFKDQEIESLIKYFASKGYRNFASILQNNAKGYGLYSQIKEAVIKINKNNDYQSIYNVDIENNIEIFRSEFFQRSSAAYRYLLRILQDNKRTYVLQKTVLDEYNPELEEIGVSNQEQKILRPKLERENYNRVKKSVAKDIEKQVQELIKTANANYSEEEIKNAVESKTSEKLLNDYIKYDDELEAIIAPLNSARQYQDLSNSFEAIINDEPSLLKFKDIPIISFDDIKDAQSIIFGNVFYSKISGNKIARFDEYFESIFNYKPTKMASLSYDIFSVLMYIYGKKDDNTKLKTGDITSQDVYIGVNGKFDLKERYSNRAYDIFTIEGGQEVQADVAQKLRNDLYEFPEIAKEELTENVIAEEKKGATEKDLQENIEDSTESNSEDSKKSLETEEDPSNVYGE